MRPLRFAVVDMYAGYPNQGLACIVELLRRASQRHFGGAAGVEVFDCRGGGQVPSLAHDVVICSGGPGSPYEGVGQAWEAAFFRFLEAVWRHNQRPGAPPRFLFAICHSFELLVRFFALGEVIPRRSPSYGIFPVHPTPEGRADPLLAGLPDPFWAADFRQWQVVGVTEERCAALGATVLAREKIRPHVPLERAVMALRVSPHVVGVQFHPEAEPSRLHALFTQPDKRREVIERHGQAKYATIQERIADPDSLPRTWTTILPRFLDGAVAALCPDLPSVRALGGQAQLAPSPTKASAI
jgi:GMP synthase-like glutamine amidotransferase